MACQTGRMRSKHEARFCRRLPRATVMRTSWAGTCWPARPGVLAWIDRVHGGPALALDIDMMSVLRPLRRPPRSAGCPQVWRREGMGSTLPRTLLVVVGLAAVAGLSAGCGGSGSNKGTESGDAGANDAASSSSGGESGSESGSALDSGGSADQAAGDAALTDGGEFACGDALCSPTQICLTPAWGCAAGAPNDAGVCPEGTEYSDASDNCLQVQPPPPSCVSPAPGAGSFDCSGIGTAAGCDIANAPIPSGCSRMCSASCA